MVTLHPFQSPFCVVLELVDLVWQLGDCCYCVVYGGEPFELALAK